LSICLPQPDVVLSGDAALDGSAMNSSAGILRIRVPVERGKDPIETKSHESIRDHSTVGLRPENKMRRHWDFPEGANDWLRGRTDSYFFTGSPFQFARLPAEAAGAIWFHEG